MSETKLQIASIDLQHSDPAVWAAVRTARQMGHRVTGQLLDGQSATIYFEADRAVAPDWVCDWEKDGCGATNRGLWLSCGNCEKDRPVEEAPPAPPAAPPAGRLVFPNLDPDSDNLGVGEMGVHHDDYDTHNVDDLRELLKIQTRLVERALAAVDNEKFDRVLKVVRSELVEALAHTQDEFGWEASQ